MQVEKAGVFGDDGMLPDPAGSQSRRLDLSVKISLNIGKLLCVIIAHFFQGGSRCPCNRGTGVVIAGLF